MCGLLMFRENHIKKKNNNKNKIALNIIIFYYRVFMSIIITT